MLVKANNIMQNPKKYYDDKPYVASTENLSYLKDFKIHGNSLVILGSGDIVFQLVANGITSIKAIEKNALQMYVFALRKAAIKTLDYNLFFDFLLDVNSSNFLSFKIFNQYVKFGFSENEQEELKFWTIFLDSHSPVRISQVFFKGGLEHCSLASIKTSLRYLKNSSYYEACKENLKKAEISTILCDAFEFFENCDYHFDFINFSNILLFCAQGSIQLLEDKMQVLKRIYDNNLNKNGIFIVDYMFGLTSCELESQKSYMLDSYSNHFLAVNMIIYAILKKYLPFIRTNYVKALVKATPIWGKSDSLFYLEK
ncbi:MAG: hypothetical protein IJ867_08465 [Clostridia bacterium]|nr:hypothetical protein [Clostridia bacterium]